MGRVLGIDYGTVRMGLAISDPTQSIASQVKGMRCVVHRHHSRSQKPSPRVQRVMVQKILEEVVPLYDDLSSFVVGFPLLLSGNEGEMAVTVKQFAEMLAQLSGRPVKLWDERLTSREAYRLLSQEMCRKKIKAHIDHVSAVLLLQSYLIWKKGKEGEGEN